MMRLTVWLTVAFSLIFLTEQAAFAEDIDGIWLTENRKAKVDIYSCDDNKCGKIIWLEEPFNDDGTPKLDAKNPDTNKHGNSLIGTIMIWDMRPDKENKWKKGQIYDASKGEIYKAKMELKDINTLSVSGCLLFICKKQIWTRSSL